MSSLLLLMMISSPCLIYRCALDPVSTRLGAYRRVRRDRGLFSSEPPPQDVLNWTSAVNAYSHTVDLQLTPRDKECL